MRYAPLSGCPEYALTCQLLEECGYATSQTYAETLISYIEKYNLTRYDEFEPEQIAPEGYLWIVQAGAYKSLMNARKFQRRLEGMGVKTLINKYRVE